MVQWDADVSHPRQRHRNAGIWARDAVTTSCAAKALTEAFTDPVLVGLGVSHENLVGDLRGYPYRKPLSAMGPLPRRGRYRALKPPITAGQQRLHGSGTPQAALTSQHATRA
jgi:hypothetical protein